MVRLSLAQNQPLPVDSGVLLSDLRDWLNSGGSVQLVGTVLQGTRIVIHRSLRAFMILNDISLPKWFPIYTMPYDTLVRLHWNASDMLYVKISAPVEADIPLV